MLKCERTFFVVSYKISLNRKEIISDAFPQYFLDFLYPVITDAYSFCIFLEFANGIGNFVNDIGWL